jgi:hypothetical protein
MLQPRGFAGGGKTLLNGMELLAHVAEDGRVHGLAEHLRRMDVKFLLICW